jgi:hypothetical protein
MITMSANGISDLSTKQLKQVAKLDLAKAKREGRVVADNGSISGSVDSTKNYYRDRNQYSVLDLPSRYVVNESIDNDNISYASYRTAKSLTINGDVHRSNTQSKFGGASLTFDGTGDYISIPTSADFGFGVGSFTIEGWYYHTVGLGNHRLLDFRTTEPELSLMLGIGSINQIYLYVNGVNRIIAGSLSLNVWNHIAVCRSGTSTKLFLNGQQSGATYTDANNYGTTRPLRIGADYNGANGFIGYMDDIRVSKGVARYTSDFDVPTVYVTNDSDTVLSLRDFTDADDSSESINDDTGIGSYTSDVLKDGRPWTT